MANAKDVQLTSLDEASFFLIGDSGSGNTPFLAQFPDIYVFDFDKGMASVRGQDVEYDVFKDSPYKAKVTFPDRGIYEFGTAWKKFFDKRVVTTGLADNAKVEIIAGLKAGEEVALEDPTLSKKDKEEDDD